MGELWDWLKRSRVWEAVRKIFLYAENWLQPEARDDSPTAGTPPEPKERSRGSKPPGDRS